MIWVLTTLVLILVSAGLTYMVVNLIYDEENIEVRDYIEMYVIVLMVMAFLVYIGG